MNRSRTVYSTEHGRICPDCGRARDRCSCKTANRTGTTPGDGIVRVGRQTKGRRGKGVTTVSGVPLARAELEELARRLKRACGSGGTVRDGVIEIQGDHRDRLVSLLAERGWTVKRAGG